MLPAALAWGDAGGKPIEILANGVAYPSMEAYKKAHSQATSIQGSASAEDEEFLRAKTKELGVEFDPQKVKTITVTPAAKARQQLQAVSYESGVGRAETGFKKEWDDPMPKFTISSGELEDRLKAVAGDRKEPVLMVADSNKLRVMALGEDKPATQ